MKTALIEKLQKILALTTSPIEGEAAAATAMLQKMLAQHNLDIADLERRGASAPSVEEKDHDLGKAAFQWKLDLAAAVASHFFCVALIDRRTKTVRFVGRPDNVEAMKSLYAWLIDQIKLICSTRRREYLLENPHDHIDPLRWQVQFGVGIVSRLGDRLLELKAKQQDEAGSALIIHHESEISDYLESKYGYRADGKRTKREEEWLKERAEMAELKKTDPEAYYAKRPWERPVVESDAEKAKREAKEAKESEAWDRKWKRRQAKALEREMNKTPEQRRADQQSFTARSAGRAAAKDVNLEPFLTTTDAPHGTTRI
jgi:hypothetical protein